MSADGFCVICKETTVPLVSVTIKGYISLLQYSIQRKDDEITKYLQKKKKKDECTLVQVHEKCRKRFNNKRRINTLTTQSNQEASTSRRSTMPNGFDPKRDCFFCSKICDSKKRARNWHLAATLEIKECSKIL